MQKPLRLLLFLVLSLLTSLCVAKTKAFSVSPSEVGGAPLLTINYMTPNGEDLAVQEARIFTGTSENACSDLSLTIDYNPVVDDMMYIANREEMISSSDLLEAFGPEKTCVKVDFIVNGETYSSGDIQLNWNEDLNEYVKASPSSVVYHFHS